MTPEQATAAVISALGDLARQFRVESRPASFARGPLAGASAVTIVRAARPGADLAWAAGVLAGMPEVIQVSAARSALHACLRELAAGEQPKSPGGAAGCCWPGQAGGPESLGDGRSDHA